MSDLEREWKIQLAYKRMLKAETSDERKQAMDEMTALINARSPEQVAKMEREQNLR